MFPLTGAVIACRNTKTIVDHLTITNHLRTEIRTKLVRTTNRTIGPEETGKMMANKVGSLYNCWCTLLLMDVMFNQRFKSSSNDAVLTQSRTITIFLKPTSAHNLCKALQGVIWRREGGTIQLVEYRRMRWESGIPLPTMAFNFPPKTRIDFRIETPVLTNGFLIETKTRSRIEQLISITSPVEIR